MERTSIRHTALGIGGQALVMGTAPTWSGGTTDLVPDAQAGCHFKATALARHELRADPGEVVWIMNGSPPSGSSSDGQ
jgi:hypothetical protein